MSTTSVPLCPPPVRAAPRAASPPVTADGGAGARPETHRLGRRQKCQTKVVASEQQRSRLLFGFFLGFPGKTAVRERASGSAEFNSLQ